MVELALKAPGKIARAVIMEDIARGERIRRYVLEGRAGQGEWRTLREGSCVGHKRIEEFEPAELSALRLRVLEAQAPPKIRLLAAHGEA